MPRILALGRAPVLLKGILPILILPMLILPMLILPILFPAETDSI